MIFGKKWWSDVVFELNLWLNVPEKLWYFDQNHGVTMAVHGRHAERVRRAMRTLRQSHTVTKGYFRLEVHATFSANKFLFFSDRSELMHPVGHRGVGYTVGSLAEFERFSDYFQVERHALEIPDVRRVDQGDGPYLGQRFLPDDFDQVIAHANRICQKSRLFQPI